MEKEEPDNREARRGRFVRLTVSDTGCGIAPEHLPHIFEPFFTTKDVGKGTGLGLATVYGIVKQHHGWLELKTELGKGTTFEIYLPAIVQESAPGMTTAPDSAVPRGTETILVVEDEAALRGVVRVVLSRLGYRVLEARSGLEAMKLWEDYRNEVDLVFTDVVMPDGVSGPQLIEELRKHDPGVKALLTSGYSPSFHGNGARFPEGLRYLQKPYPPQQLATAVRGALDGCGMS
jgi:CheY-like chemotaxis protein